MLYQSRFKQIRALLCMQGGGTCVLHESEEFEWLRPMMMEKNNFKNIRRISIFCIFKRIFGDFVFSIDCVTAIAFEGISKAYILDNCSLCHTEQLLYRHAVLIVSFWGSRHSKPYKNSEKWWNSDRIWWSEVSKKSTFCRFFFEYLNTGKKIRALLWMQGGLGHK